MLDAPPFGESFDDGLMVAVTFPKESQRRSRADDGRQFGELRRLERDGPIAQPALGTVDGDADGLGGKEQQGADQDQRTAPAAQPRIAQVPDAGRRQQAHHQEAHLLQQIPVDRTAAIEDKGRAEDIFHADDDEARKDTHQPEDVSPPAPGPDGQSGF